MPTDAEWAELTAKLDSLTKELEALKTPPAADSTPKLDARDTSLAKGKAFFLTYLDKTLPREKLDTLSFDELVLASELKSQISPVKLNPAPPIDKTDAGTTDSRPAYLRATVEGS